MGFLILNHFICAITIYQTLIYIYIYICIVARATHKFPMHEQLAILSAQYFSYIYIYMYIYIYIYIYIYHSRYVPHIKLSVPFSMVNKMVGEIGRPYSWASLEPIQSNFYRKLLGNANVQRIQSLRGPKFVELRSIN